MHYSGALALASLKEMSGGWLFAEQGQLRMADVRLREMLPAQSVDDVFDSWKQEAIREPISKVRRIVHLSGPLVDLQTGSAVNEAGIDSLAKLLAQSRRDLRFLVPENEVAS